VLIPKASFPTIIAADTTDILGRLLKEVEGLTAIAKGEVHNVKMVY
jgi:hypothetical protein